MAKQRRTLLEYWEDYLKNPHPLIQEWLEEENKYLRRVIRKGSTVLDVGCGFGRNIIEIAKATKRVVGIDNCAIQLFKKIRNRLANFENVVVYNDDASNMVHCHTQEFDYTICMGNTFGDLADQKVPILKEMKRVTKKGGLIIISVYAHSPLTLKVRLQGYKSIGLKITKVDPQSGTVYADNNGGLILEQFTKPQLENIFAAASLQVQVKHLSEIAYICEAKV
jgi:SAM-dependent methyltransferase